MYTRHRPSRAAGGRRLSLPSLAHASPCCHRGCMPTISPHLPCLPVSEVPAGHRPFLQGYATGTQNYICLPNKAGPGFFWDFFGPQATLFNDNETQITTHFLSPNPDEGGMARATWQHSRDTSTVWAMLSCPPPIPFSWSRMRFPGCCSRWWEQPADPLGGRLTETTYLQRVHTSGGIKPATG